MKRQQLRKGNLDKTNGSRAGVIYPRDLAGTLTGWAVLRLHLPGESVLKLKVVKSMRPKSANRPIQGLELPLSYS